MTSRPTSKIIIRGAGVITAERGQITSAPVGAGRTPSVKKADRPGPARSRLPLALTRTLGVQCSLCGGVGCAPCANSGMS